MVGRLDDEDTNRSRQLHRDREYSSRLCGFVFRRLLQHHLAWTDEDLHDHQQRYCAKSDSDQNRP